ncbi:unnamed protein product (macronuclear) [Paramecium tetraurelia]|uniref:Uncharacterized protein n=1 Tax=Paramecium tetraurelia TaxID=5888 RepID=A0DJT2_PARTE|nr:uncharacterized protein GSPATT00017643001 [Paramecium tetraurelia]CAK83299.1 unnamed protein product [Paramecium tetraurelia]|eukprot:XP_001450696.1 hypothetical protein (macronuclear) [Paramecium tetraurelia strain d4-2]
MSSFTGFLVKKTIQDYPIRQQLGYYQDFQRQNLTLYINKKLADMRLSNGTNSVNAKSLVNLNIQTNIDTPNKVGNFRRRQISQQECQSRPKTSYHKKQHKVQPKPEQKVASLINDELMKQNSTSSLYQEYKMANLKANLQKLQAQKKCNLIELNHVELADDEQINYYLTELCKQHPEVDIGKLLDVDVEKVSLIHHQDKLNELIEKRINQEEFDQLLSKDEKTNLVKVYKESRYDQFEPEYSKKNKLKMTTFKKQKEIQDKLFAQIFEDEVQNKTQKVDMNKFFRAPPQQISGKIKRRSNYAINSKPLSHRQSPGVSHFESRPQTALGTHTQSQTFLTTKQKWDGKGVDPDTQQQMQDIIGYCIELEDEQKKEKKQFKRKMRRMDQEIQRSVRTVSEQFHNQDKQTIQHEEFKKFQSETQFKRKLIGFLMNQVADKNEILSQKARKESTSKFIHKVSKLSNE